MSHNEESGYNTCKICMENSIVHELFNPCTCRQQVHKECLYKWRQIQKDEERDKCVDCKTLFIIENTSDSNIKCHYISSVFKYLAIRLIQNVFIFLLILLVTFYSTHYDRVTHSSTNLLFSSLLWYSIFMGISGTIIGFVVRCWSNDDMTSLLFMGTIYNSDKKISSVVLILYCLAYGSGGLFVLVSIIESVGIIIYIEYNLMCIHIRSIEELQNYILNSQQIKDHVIDP